METSPPSFLKKIFPPTSRRALAMIVPRFLTTPFYYLLFAIGAAYLKWRVRSAKFRIWPRNSLVLNSARFATSDLDLTVVSSPATTSQSIRHLMAAKRDLQRWLPMFGEINWYSHEDLASISELINFFELERDPILLRFLDQRGLAPHRDRGNDPIEKFIFLVRMIYYDGRELHSAPRLRFEKWKSHFSMLGLPPIGREELTLDRVMAATAGLLPELSASDAARLGETLKDIAIHNLQFHQGVYSGVALQNPDWLWALFPYSMGYYTVPAPRLTELQIKVLERQMDWELFGMLTQHRHKETPQLLPTHLEVVTKTFRNAESAVFEPSIKKTEYVLSRLNYYNTL